MQLRAHFTTDVFKFPLAEDDDFLKDLDSPYVIPRLTALRKRFIAATDRTPHDSNIIVILNHIDRSLTDQDLGSEGPTEEIRDGIPTRMSKRFQYTELLFETLHEIVNRPGGLPGAPGILSNRIFRTLLTARWIDALDPTHKTIDRSLNTAIAGQTGGIVKQVAVEHVLEFGGNMSDHLVRAFDDKRCDIEGVH